MHAHMCVEKSPELIDIEYKILLFVFIEFKEDYYASSGFLAFSLFTIL